MPSPLVVDNPHTLWADCGGGGGRRDVAAIAALGATALSYKISEGRAYIDPNGQWHHDQALAHNLFPIPYVFPLPASCGMSVTDQAKRDAALIHSQHGSFTGIGIMLDLEYEPGQPGWGPFQLSTSDATSYVATIKALTGMKVGGYTGAGYAYNGREGFDWRVVPNYSYSGSPQGLDVILRQLNGGVTWMPPAPAWRQFTDAVDVSGSPTDFNIAPITPDEFLAIVGGGDEVTPADIQAIVKALTPVIEQQVSNGVRYTLGAILGTPAKGQQAPNLIQLQSEIQAALKAGK